MDSTRKKYSNGEVTVVWQPNLCIHSKICWAKATGLPEVFDPQARPWININGADTDRIIATVKKCPTNALSFYMNCEKTDDAGDENNDGISSACDYDDTTFVQVMKDGPLMVYGNITVKGTDGNETRKDNVTAFCRCGASGTNPYCDGTHYDINFSG